ncbi:hypothetical protein RI129_008748 [Pyrocoelia pectoralis]|uniref:Zinc finger CCCH domain-containing protein 3 n=1 Tax=Pyrocoelia pectoralis TaxID=417401 RepID=A0AAN7VBN6_9COLE
MEGQRFMYVKQELLENIRQNQGRVLINPNFVNTALVKPHFNKQFLLNQPIHINPYVINQNRGNQRTVVLIDDGKVVTDTKEKRKEISKQPLLISTPTKIVRSSNRQTATPQKRRLSIHSKYKIIRSCATTNILQPSLLGKEKNNFTIDHRSPAAKLKRFSFIKDKLKMPNIYMKNNLNSTKYISVNGKVHKKNFVHNNTKFKRKPLVGSALKVQILTIRGQKYKMDSAHHTLTLISSQTEKPKSSLKTLYVGGMSFKQKEPNLYVKTNAHKRFVLLSQAKQRSINTLTNKLRKSNIPCPLYHKFGKCKGLDSGKCIRLHNPDQISLCPRFLQGACTDTKCLLSHKVSAEKMPTCKFFLEGLCSKDDCPYLHVKINSKAEICKDFLEGFCRRAAECEKRHEYLCPNYERLGQCSKSNCHYPHGSVVRKRKISKLILPNLQGKVKHKIVNKKKVERTVKQHNHAPKCTDDKTKETDVNIRYYDDFKVGNDIVQSTESDINMESALSLVAGRPKLGTLPSFIPFLDKDQSVTDS